uniref:Tetratricopeptide repeat protein 38 n=1 Tax=Aegilops tauschii subsp. strangulata TaxID=200361 RepID=A0A453H3R9_AEGTS
MAEAEGEVRRDMWGQDYRTASADCAAALDDYYAQTMSFGRGRGRAVLRAAAADPACALAALHAAHFVGPRDRAGAAAFLAAAAGSLVLPENQDRNYIYGMLAFPLLELGRMDEAEIAARKGLAINKNDFWSQHNMCHVFQQECRFREATEFMESCSPSWTSCSSFMFTHNWWHVAVCYLEGEAPIRKVMEVYDQNIMKELDRSDCEPAEVYVNALGLLLRLYVRGEIGPAKERLTPLLDELKNESIWHAEWLLDLLILWALSSMNEVKAAENLLDSLQSRVSSMDMKRQQVMQKA